MNPLRVIERVRDGERLPEGSLEEFLVGYLAGEVQEYQMAAFLMAVVLKGLDPAELSRLVGTMRDSGSVLEFSGQDRPPVDKHSTGGVGDKVSLALAPLAAEGGVLVPMLAGRGLGHTGGTLDKLEAIPGFRTELSLEELYDVVEDVGAVIAGQTKEIAPLDRRLYALRSVTGTVPSIPLIAASIMSKKLAEGLTGLVLDVKVGRGALLAEEAQALALARTLVRIGTDHGLQTVALLTAMDRPLGRAVGNALEVKEAVACLGGGGPPDLREVVTTLAGEMFGVAGVADDPEAGRALASEILDGGSALERFGRMIARQGGDPRVLERPSLLPEAPVVEEVRSRTGGVVASVDPLVLGRAVIELGGGRTRLGQGIDRGVGFVLRVTPGEEIEAGTLLGSVHAKHRADAEVGAERLRDAVRLDPPGAAVSIPPLMSHRITASEGPAVPAD